MKHYTFGLLMLVHSNSKAVGLLASRVMDLNFWQRMSHLKLILQPIHEAQIMSEANNAHLGHVVKRW